jgi:hypothetical protein
MGKGYDAGPCDREAKVWNANGRKTGDVLLVQVVRHGRDFSIDFARLSTNVADSSNDIHCCGSSAVFSEPAFDLEGTAGHSPDEALGKFVAVDADVLRLGTGGVQSRWVDKLNAGYRSWRCRSSERNRVIVADGGPEASVGTLIVLSVLESSGVSVQGVRGTGSEVGTSLKRGAKVVVICAGEGSGVA